MRNHPDWLASELERRGVTRREFVRFCAAMASALALPDHFDFFTNPFVDMKADIILITEKDAVKCVRIAGIAQDPRLWIVPVEASIAEPLAQHILEKLRG